MTRRLRLPGSRSALAAAATIALLVSLAACAPAVPLNTQAHSGSAANGSASPTPKPKPLAPPVVRINATCPQLASLKAIATSIGATTKAVTPLNGGNPDFTLPEDGALTCNWSENYAADAQEASNHFQVWVLPDVPAANWTAAVSTLTQLGETTTTLIDGNTYGSCIPATPEGTLCTVDTMVGTTWLSFEVESLSKTFDTSDAGLSHFAPLLDPIITDAGISNFVTEPKWTDPGATATPTDCATILPNSEVASASGAKGLRSNNSDHSDRKSATEFWGAALELGEAQCGLASSNEKDYFEASILPGGGWAWNKQLDTDRIQRSYANVPSLGSRAVEFTDLAGDAATIDWVRGGNLCSIYVILPPGSKPIDVALALATYLNTKIAG